MSRSWRRPFLSGAGVGADPTGTEPESAPGPWASGAGAGAAQKSGGFATVNRTILKKRHLKLVNKQGGKPFHFLITVAV